MADGFGLRRFGIGAGFLKAVDGLCEKSGVESGRNFAVGSAGAVDQFGQLAIGAFLHARI